MMNRRGFLKTSAAVTVLPMISACAAEDHVTEIDTRLPVSSFGADSTAEDVTVGMDLQGKVVMVTGCTSGLGYETLRVLALRGAHVIGTGRTLAKAQSACDGVGGTTTPIALELSNLQSSVDCAATLREMGLSPDILICNAGINTFGDLELVNGIEKTFLVNYLGHFVLVNQMLPALLESTPARIVHVGSGSAYMNEPAAGIDFDNLRGEKEFDAWEAYGQSKLANALFSSQLSKRLEGTGVTSNVIHPGLVKTNIARTAPAYMKTAFEWFGGVIAKTPAEGAATQVYVATNPIVEGVSGAYFVDCNPVTVTGDHHLLDEQMAARLWATGEEMAQGFLV
jgi:NAD(P)-dependent dehydrogenase (short-subunit alcohol dehydrogenase family)